MLEKFENLLKGLDVDDQSLNTLIEELNTHIKELNTHIEEFNKLTKVCEDIKNDNTISSDYKKTIEQYYLYKSYDYIAEHGKLMDIIYRPVSDFLKPYFEHLEDQLKGENNER